MSEFESQSASAPWAIVTLKTRVDSFTHSALSDELKALSASGSHRIALDLRGNRFFCLQAIKACVEMAQTLARAGGAFALIGCNERTKRHFEVYGTLNHILVVRDEAGLNERPETPPVRPTFRASSPEAS